MTPRFDSAPSPLDDVSSESDLGRVRRSQQRGSRCRQLPSLAACFVIGLTALIGQLSLSAAAHAALPGASDVLHFQSGGHHLGFDERGYQMKNPVYALDIRFEGGHGSVSAEPAVEASTVGLRKGEEFKRVSYRDVWPGIDVIYDAPESKILRSTWTIEAEVDPTAIRLRYNRPVALDASGELKIRFSAGTVTESAPLAWQDVDGSRAPVEVAFRKIDDSLVGFEVGAYRKDLPLVIDPSVDFDAGNGFVSFAGTRFAADNGRDLLVVGDGTGDTISSTLFGGYAAYSDHQQYVEARDNDKLRMNVASVVNNGSRGSDLVVSRQDEFGNLEWMTVIGNRYSGSSSAPLHALGAYAHETIITHPSKPKRRGNGMHLTAGGRLFLVGSSEADWEGLKCAPGGCGAGESNTLPIDPPLTPHTGDGHHDIWLAEFDPATGDLLWHTFVQGPGGDQFASDFDIDGSGNFWIAASSTSDFNLPGGQEPVHQFWTDFTCSPTAEGCWRDGTYVTSENPGVKPIVGVVGAPTILKLDPNGAPLLHTFYGGGNGSAGNGTDYNSGTFRAIHFDAVTGDVFVAGAGGGQDNSCDDDTLGSQFNGTEDVCVFPEDRSNGSPRRFPTGTRFDTAVKPNHDVVLMRLDGNTLNLACSTYLGGWGVDQPAEIFDLGGGGLTIVGTSSNEWTERDGSPLAGATIVKPFTGTAVQCVTSPGGPFCTSDNRPDLVDQRGNGHEPFVTLVDRDCFLLELGFPSEEAGNASLEVYSAIYSTSKGKLFLAGETGASVGGSKSPFSGGTDGLLMEVDPATYSATGVIYAGGSSDFRTHNGNQDWITAIAEAGTEEFFINGTSKASWETDTDAYLGAQHSGSFYTDTRAAESSKDGFGARVSAPGGYCGDGNVDVALGEACDDSGETALCNADCTESYCGDGVANATAGEDCDSSGVETATCNPDCTAPTCGDGYINALSGETCEEAVSPTPTATCDSDCSAPSCGDGVTNPATGEDCDDAGESATCDADCTLVVCGDGVLNTLVEDCEEGGVETATCNPDCTAPTCGDGYINALSGETCEEPTSPTPTTTCDSDCTAPACGDGVINPATGEDCDDAGESANCNLDCTTRVCGDSYLNTVFGETCEEATSPASSATCDSDCTAPACGDGVLNTVTGEECDTGGATAYCSAACENVGVISGNVVFDNYSNGPSQHANSQENGIPDVTIVLYDVAAGTCQATKTQNFGRWNEGGGSFSFEGLPEGEYRIYEAFGEDPDNLTACPPTETYYDQTNRVMVRGTVADPDYTTYVDTTNVNAFRKFTSTTSNRVDVTLTFALNSQGTCTSSGCSVDGVQFLDTLNSYSYDPYSPNTMGTAGAITIYETTSGSRSEDFRDLVTGKRASSNKLTTDQRTLGYGYHNNMLWGAGENNDRYGNSRPVIIISGTKYRNGKGENIGTNKVGLQVFNLTTPDSSYGYGHRNSVTAVDYTDADAAAMHPDGYFLQWGSPSAPASGYSNAICWLDVSADRLTYLNRVDSVTKQPATTCTSVTIGTDATDFAVHPGDLHVYAIQTGTGHLLVTDPVSGQQHLYEDVLPASACSGEYGAVFFDVDGYFFAQCNATGEVWRVDLTNPPALGAAHTFTTVHLSTSGGSGYTTPTTNMSNVDGARFALSAVRADFGDHPASYGTMLDADGARHGCWRTTGSNGYSSSKPKTRCYGGPDGWLSLGDSRGDEADGQPAANSDADSADDGLVSADWSADFTTLGVTVKITNNTYASDGSSDAPVFATVGCYVDWNEDGSFNTAEEYAEAAVSGPRGSANVALSWTTPAGQVSSPSVARCRVSTEASGVRSPTGLALDGEIEDFRLSLAKIPICGDSVIDAPGEDCDDGGESATCNADCTTAVCGDQIINATAGETCDEAGSPTASATCDSDCTDPVCGDGLTNAAANEDCDDSGESATCNADCSTSVCGDGITNTTANESCDDSGESATCNADCSTSVCGDGITNATSNESCDDSGESATCNADCSTSVCGDGITNATSNEDCDDSGESATCNADCSTSVCGDGITNATSNEDCDDSGESATCNADCSTSVCGDGIANTTSGEQCDDGVATAACTADCRTLSTISGQVYLDANANQASDAGDSGIDGVTVVLYDVAADSCQSIETAGGGSYAFPSLLSGSYRIYEASGETAGALTECPPTESTIDLVTKAVAPGTIQDPAGHMSTTPNRLDVTLGTVDLPDQNFGDYQLSAVSCEETGYLFQQSPTEIWEVDLVTGAAVDTGFVLSTTGNGFGYNVLDGLFWGNDQTATDDTDTPMLVVVASDGGHISLPCENCPTTASYPGHNAGDVSLDGYLLQWQSVGGATENQLCWYDVNPQRATYLQRVDAATKQPSTGCLPVGATQATDGGFNPVDGLVYAAANNLTGEGVRSGDIYQWNPVTGAGHLYTDVIPTECSDTYGAQFFDAEGFLYVACNASGVIHRLDLTDPPVLGGPHDFKGVFFSDGPASTSNDGARCSLVETPDLDLADAPDTYGTSLSADGARHKVSGTLTLGLVVDEEDDGQPTSDATGDDLDGSPSDEDGLALSPQWQNKGTSIVARVTVTNTTGGTAYVGCYLDFDEDGTFNTVDEYAEAESTASGEVELRWATPVGQLNGPSILRCRLSSDQTAVQTPTGPAGDGEVEDHQVTVPPNPCPDPTTQGEQSLRGMRFKLADKSGGDDPRRRRFWGRAFHSINGNTAIGQPDVCGATIELIANGTNPTRQKFTLPETNWASVGGGKRFIYKDPDNEHSPVVQMVLAQQSRRRFSIMAFARGAPSSPVPLEMVPPNEGTDAWMIVQIGAGDRYCAHYSSDATVRNRGDRLFEVKRSEVESPCPPL